MNSGLLDAGMCRQAVEMAMPSITALMQKGVFKRSQMSIVIVDPLIVPGSMPRHEFLSRGILHAHEIGDKAKWDYEFDVFAKAKAYLTWRHGLSTHAIQTQHPYLIGTDDVLYYGSAVSDGRLVVAASGDYPYFDAMVSAWVRDAIIALSIAKRETINPNTNGPFLK